LTKLFWCLWFGMGLRLLMGTIIAVETHPEPLLAVVLLASGVCMCWVHTFGPLGRGNIAWLTEVIWSALGTSRLSGLA
jgi:hypothetical protein